MAARVEGLEKHGLASHFETVQRLALPGKPLLHIQNEVLINLQGMSVK
jgi:hypothetical protein